MDWTMERIVDYGRDVCVAVGDGPTQIERENLWLVPVRYGGCFLPLP